MYNCHSRKNNKEYWRCHNYSKKMKSERCRSRCVLENGTLKCLSGGEHNHPPHTEKIAKMMDRNRSMGHHLTNATMMPRIKIPRRTISVDCQKETPITLSASQHTHPTRHLSQSSEQHLITQSTLMLISDE